VGVLLLLHFYIYAVMGTFLFQHNDPIRFGNLHSSMMTLFEVLTLEGWNDVFNTQMLGSNHNYPEDWIKLAGSERVSTGRPIAAAAYFVSFILLGTMIMLNLFTGVIINSMQEAQAHHDEAVAAAADIAKDIPNPQMNGASLSSVDEKLRVISNQLYEVSQDIVAIKEQTT
jgi:voltage-gated sodium channel